MTPSMPLERVHEALAAGAEVVTDERNVTAGSIYFALRKHDSGTRIAGVLWAAWGWCEFHLPGVLVLADRLTGVLPGALRRRWTALRAYRFNGNAFAEKALKKGAALVVMDRPGLSDRRVVRVSDVRQAFYRCANEHRLRHRARVIGVTGSCGKTTTKEYLAHLLSSHYKVNSTEGSFNTYEGLCLTLFKIRPDTDFAVLEISSSGANDVEGKSRIACPDIGIITVIGKAHLEGFGGIEGVRAVKRKLSDVVREREGLIVLNQDDPVLVELAGDYPNALRHGAGAECDIQGNARPACAPLALNWRCKGEMLHEVQTRIFGALNLTNILAAIAVAREVGVPEEKIDRALESYEPQNMRSQILRYGDVTLILDAYNANPTSMNAALKDFSTTVKGHRTVILGDMLELGEHSRREHSAVLDAVKNAGFDAVYLVGREFGAVLDGQMPAEWFGDAEALRAHLMKHKPAETTLLIKGSRGIGLEKLLAVWQM